MCLGIPGQITQITDADQKLALVDISGVRRQVNIACVVDAAHPIDACVGDWVLVHVGFAMNRIDEQEARLTMALLTEMAEVHEAMGSEAMGPEAMDQAVGVT